MQRASNPLPAPAPETGAARSSTPGAKARLGLQTAVSNAMRNDNSSRPGALLVSTMAMPLGSLQRLGICKAESLEGLADQLKSGFCRPSLVGLLGNQPSEIGHVLTPHARSPIIAFDAVDGAVIPQQRCRGDTLQRTAGAIGRASRDTSPRRECGRRTLTSVMTP